MSINCNLSQVTKIEFFFFKLVLFQFVWSQGFLEEEVNILELNQMLFACRLRRFKSILVLYSISLLIIFSCREFMPRQIGLMNDSTVIVAQNVLTWKINLDLV